MCLRRPFFYARQADVTLPWSFMSFSTFGLSDEIVRAVNQVGASPGDLMAILEAMKQAGALSAELIVI